MSISKVVIPAAGLGTRLLPATKSQPKEMLPVVDRPAIQYVVEEAKASGIDDILIITGRGKRTLEDHFDRSIELERHLEAKGDMAKLAAVRSISDGPATYFIRQKEPKGLGHAVLCAEKHMADQSFAVMLGDDIFVSEPPAIAQMIELYNNNPGIIIALQEVSDSQIPLYGIVSVCKKQGKALLIDDLVEKPSLKAAPSNLAIVGRYILTPEIFDALKSIEADKKGEFQ
ncbi:MAG TPA: UTP--glucose-1-phosphate uridylyltransferase, partial [Actinobacteria bacterium]|nr:UTP--glucose-1-phosphate uridylyltransferase [Actinomycetes bacterium]HEX21727.1 UTP--glucose-1-phosphate uridylyltransferase [Actinomycetota bacterium]